MAKIIFKRNRIDPTKISGPYPLLAVMLLVAEILFAIWFCKAENSAERSIAGLIMATFFVCLMVMVMKMNRIHDNRKKANNPINLFVQLEIFAKDQTVRKWDCCARRQSYFECL